MILTIGVDPGNTGAIAFLVDGKLVDIKPMPVTVIERARSNKRPRADGKKQSATTKKTRISEDGVGGIFCPLAGQDFHVFVEQVGTMPDQSITGAFTFGEGFGIVKGVLGAFQLRRTFVRPQTWKKTTGCFPGDEGSIKRVCELFPEWSNRFTRANGEIVKNRHDKADAVLIGYHGYLQLKTGI